MGLMHYSDGVWGGDLLQLEYYRAPTVGETKELRNMDISYQLSRYLAGLLLERLLLLIHDQDNTRKGLLRSRNKGP